MKRDYSYHLYVPVTERRGLLQALRAACAADYHPAIDAAIDDPTTRDCMFSLSLAPEPAVAQFGDWYPDFRAADGSVQVGGITAFLREERLTEGDSLGFVIWLWPVASTVQWTCRYAQQFRDLLVRLLESCQGSAGILHDGNGSYVPFWTATEGRLDDAYPPFAAP